MNETVRDAKALPVQEIENDVHGVIADIVTGVAGSLCGSAEV